MTATPEMAQSVDTLAQLLATSTDSGNSLRVPEYQRSYAWKKRQYEQFWNDLLEFADDDSRSGSMYFLGIVVFVKSDEREILDGQQRLSTATILLTSIARFLEELGETDYAKKIIDDYVVGSSLGGDDRTYRLILNSHDRSYFRELIQDGVEATSDGTRSHTNIRGCKRFFDGKLRAWLKTDPEKPELAEQAKSVAIARAKRLAESFVYRVYVVSITAIRLNEAGYVFERLNDRGVGLSSVDLVRSWVMQRCKESDSEIILTSWGQIFQVQGRVKLDDLLRFHWIMRWGDRSDKPQHMLIKDEFTKQPPDPSYTPLQFTRELQHSASVYEELCGAKEGEIDDAYPDVASWVLELDVKPLIPLLMKLYGFEDAEHRAVVAKSAFTAFIRNRLVADQSSTSFEDVVYRVTRDIEPGRSSVKSAIDELARYTFNDSDFKRAFAARALRTQKHAKFLLRGIESYLLREASGGNNEVRLGTSAQVHLEHIYPKKPMEGHVWDRGEQWVHRLGNMTLLASKLNTKIQNQPFGKKMRYYKDSQLNVTAQLLGYESWSTDQIEDRQNWLADLALKVWPKEV